jgi:cytochrome P450
MRVGEGPRAEGVADLVHGPTWGRNVRAAIYSKRVDELFGAEAIEDPHLLYARLRREHPISRVGETGVHLVATWDLIEEALRRETDFSANLTGVLIREADGRPGTFELPDTGANHVIATADEPAHRVHRALVKPGLSSRRIASLEPHLLAWTEQAIEPWVAAGGGDFVPIAEVIPARVVAYLLGLPDGDGSRHRAWAMMGGDILAGGVSAQRLIELATETGQMAEYLGAQLDAATPVPAGDAGATMLATLAGAVARGEIERVQAIGMAIIMFGAGGESTAALIGSTVRCLAADPETAQALRRDPQLVPRFVEEVARLEPPFKFHYRAVRTECELGGVELVPGDRLMLVWASANRDPAQFEDPDTLRLDRQHPKHHMSFGRGRHFCVGAPLARLEARLVLEQLLARTKSIALCASARPAHASSIFVRRLEHLPVEVEAA